MLVTFHQIQVACRCVLKVDSNKSREVALAGSLFPSLPLSLMLAGASS